MGDRPLRDFKANLRLWGSAYTGDVLETAAVVSESRLSRPGVEGARFSWDKTEADRQHTLISHGDEPERPMRYWGCLPWGAEHIRRLELPWPGL